MVRIRLERSVNLSMGDAPACNICGSHGTERNLLPLYDVREYKRVLLASHYNQ